MSRVLAGATVRCFLWEAIVIAAMSWSVGSSLLVYPHSMSYFNELAGGPKNGSTQLIDSNIDWGQDLFYLKRWLDDHPEAQPLGFAYFGYIDPRVAGIEFSLPPIGITEEADRSGADQDAIGPRPGWYVVSVTFLRGYRFPLADGKGGLENPKRGSFTYFQRFQPVATAGYSIFVYHISRDECNRARAELGLSPLRDIRARERGSENGM
jgi:hypothetical protein